MQIILCSRRRSASGKRAIGKARPEWDKKASGPSSLLGDETSERLGDFLIPHLDKELPAVRENEVSIEGRKRWPSDENASTATARRFGPVAFYRHRLAGRTQAENSYKGSSLALLRRRISTERAGVEVRARPNVTRRGRGGTQSTPGGTSLRGIRTRSGRTNRGGTAACPDGRSPRREGLASKRSSGADTAHTASVPRRREASAKAFDRIVAARRTRPSATCALAGNGRMAERGSHWSPARFPATPRVTRHR